MPFFPLDLLHISALCDPGEGHSIQGHPQAETFTNGIVQCLLKKEIKPQATGIKGISPYVSKIKLRWVKRGVSFYVGRLFGG